MTPLKPVEFSRVLKDSFERNLDYEGMGGGVDLHQKEEKVLLDMMASL